MGRRNGWQEAFELPALVAALGLAGVGGRVLEVGCGRGVALPALARWLRPARLVGVDVDGTLLALASERAAARGIALELLAADVRRLPLPDASFDLVVDFGTCYHVSRRAEALREIARVLAPGGRLVYETRLNQRLAHPLRSRGRRLPWHSVPELVPARRALLWESRRRTG